MSTKPNNVWRRAKDRWMMQGLAIVLAILALAPFLWLLVMSFKTNAEIFHWPPRLFLAPTTSPYSGLYRIPSSAPVLS